MNAIPAEFRKQLLDALLQIPALAGAEGRSLLLLDMPASLVVVRSDNQAIDLAAIVGAVSGLGPLPDGTPALAALIENALELAGQSSADPPLQALLVQAQHDAASAGLTQAALPDQPGDPVSVPASMGEPASALAGAIPGRQDADLELRYRDLLEAANRGDWRVVLDLGATLPAAYPGLAPLLQRARGTQQQRQDLYTAIYQAFGDHDWDQVVQLGADLPTTDPIVSSMVGEARQNLVAGGAGSPEAIRQDAGSTGHSAPVTAVGWAPDGRHYASASADGTVTIWAPDQATPVRVLPGDGGVLSCLAWEPQGDYLAAAGRKGLVLLWDAATGALRGELFAHNDWIRALAWAPDPTAHLASGDDSGLILVWNWPEGQVTGTLKGHTGPILGLDWAPDGSPQLISGSWDTTLRLWDTARQAAVSTMRNQGAGVHCVAWGPGGRGIATGSNDKQVRIWDAGLTRLLRTLSRDGAGAPPQVKAYKGGIYTATSHDGEVTAVAWRPDGRLLASASSDYTIRLWDTQTWTATRTLTGHQAAVTSVAWSPDGTLLASASDDATVRLWRIA